MSLGNVQASAMRLAVLAASMLLVASCGAYEDEGVTRCEEYIKGKLKAPSTYKRIKADGIALKSEKPPYYSVMVEYDAANSFGVPLRSTQICKFPIVDGLPVSSGYIDHDAEIMKASDAAVDDAVAAAEKAAAQ